MNFLKIFTWVIIVFSLFACSSVDGFNFLDAFYKDKGLERYVVYTSKTAQDRRSERAKEAILKSNGKIHKKMRYHDAYVAFLDPDKIKPEAFSGVIFEKDIIHEMRMDGCQQKPDPDLPPPPDEQPKEIYDWGSERIGADYAHQFNQGEGVKVCIVDTGLDRSHIEFSSPDKVLACESFVDGESCDDLESHGTHVAGIVAADLNGVGIVGTAPKAKLLIMKALDRFGSGYSSDIADAVKGCMNQGADIINMSLGASSPSSVIHNAIIEAYNQGAIIVAAAGNDGGAVGYPAAFRETVAVSSMNPFDDISYFSSRGQEISFIGAGSEIYSSVPNSNYATFSGTSMASPQIAGVYALLLSSGKSMITEDLNLLDTEQGLGLPNLKEIFK